MGQRVVQQNDPSRFHYKQFVQKGISASVKMSLKS